MLKTFCMSIKIIPVFIPLSMHNETKFVSRPRHKPVEKFALKSDQTVLNQKEIKFNLLNIFSILIFKLFSLKTRVRFTFMKYLASVVYLIFLPKTLI